MTTYYKAVRPDGRDFFTGTVDYGAALITGEVLAHPTPNREGAGGYFSISTSPTDCTGMQWPCRLLIVQPVDATGLAVEPWTPDSESLPNKRACHFLRVVGERPAYEALGPNGEHVTALIERLTAMTLDEAKQAAVRYAAAGDAAGDAAWYAARDAAGDAARDAARAAARDTARDAVGDAARAAAWYAARDAVGAVVIRDLISREHYDILTGPIRSLGWRIHPDAPEWSTP